MTKDVISVCLVHKSRPNLPYCNIAVHYFVMCYIVMCCLYNVIYTGDGISTTIIISISTGCGVMCTVAVLITMVTTYVCIKKKNKSGYNIGVLTDSFWMFIMRLINVNVLVIALKSNDLVKIIEYPCHVMFDLHTLYYTTIYGSGRTKTFLFLPFTADPITAPNPVYDVVVKCSNDPITADNPVYGVRIDVTT